MTDEQYHDMMNQMYDLGMLVMSDRDDDQLRTTLMHRLGRRCDDAALVTNLAEAKTGITYCITLVKFDDDAVLPLLTKGFVVGSLVKVLTRTGDCLEVDLMGCNIAIRNEQAKAFSIIRFPEQG